MNILNHLRCFVVLAVTLVAATLANVAQADGAVESAIRAIPTADKPNLSQVVVAITEERSAQIVVLRKMFELAKAEKCYAAASGALRALGAMKAVEALDFLIENMTFADPADMRSLYGDGPITFMTAEEAYPAVTAIQKIGPVCTDQLLRLIAKRDLAWIELDHIGRLLLLWHGRDEGLGRVRAFAAGVPDETVRKRFENQALLQRLLDKTSK